ncbi:MAG TPA: hypothetical protein VGT60_04510, partial [Candidatus Limnocylindria bacterium]|nr:hypothetical protein [Candidatus Limnocylindria bacterium]
AVPVAVVEVTPAPTDAATAPPATSPPGTGTSGGGTAGGGSGGGTGNGNGRGTPAPTASPRPTPTPTPAPTPTIDPANLMHVQGRVVDSSSGRGLPGVCYGPGIVNCAGAPVTDAFGNWSMDIDVARNPNTTWRVLFITPGYQTGSISFQSRRGTTTVPPIRLRVR